MLLLFLADVKIVRLEGLAGGVKEARDLQEIGWRRRVGFNEESFNLKEFFVREGLLGKTNNNNTTV